MRRARRFRFTLNNTFDRISEEADYLKNEEADNDKIAPILEQFTLPGAITIKGILFILLVAALLCGVIFPLLSNNN